MCLSCGICVAVCPKKCIQMDGENRPVVDKNQCIGCSKCLTYCPVSDRKLVTEIGNSVRAAYVGRTRNLVSLKNAVSGGVVAELVTYLIQYDAYDFSLVVGIPNFDRMNVEVYEGEKDYSFFQKSVYTMPNYEMAVHYILTHPDKRGIIVASGCILNSLRRIVEDNRELRNGNYLFIGLFCGYTLNENINLYFRRFFGSCGREVRSFQYREKCDGWPGDMSFLLDNGKVIIPREERYNIVDYFKNKNCLLCVNKLNEDADISIGDNYTGIYSDKLGSNSIIVRTEKGEKALKQVKGHLDLREIEWERILNSQNKEEIVRHEYFKKTWDGNVAQSHLLASMRKKGDYDIEMAKIKVGKLYKLLPGAVEIYFLIKRKTKLSNRMFARIQLMKSRKQKC